MARNTKANLTVHLGWMLLLVPAAMIISSLVMATILSAEGRGMMCWKVEMGTTDYLVMQGMTHCREAMVRTR